MTAIPVIDFSGLIGNDAGRVASEIGLACQEVGFFYVTGHAVPPDFRTAVFDASACFFAQTDAQTLAVLYTAAGNRGYVPMQGEAPDPGKPADLKEAFNIGLDLPDDDPDVVAGRRFRAANLWPELAGFRDTMLAYFAACQDLGRVLHRTFALDLDLPTGFFDDKLDRPMAVLRLHYPAAPTQTEAGQLGAGEHSDYGCVTLLATDGVGGLQVQSRMVDWPDAPYVPGAFVCNIGDCLMRWTNDIYISTHHRVVSPAGRERFSVAFFVDPNPEAEIACLPGCATSGRPVRYAPIRGDAFLTSRLSSTYQKSGLAP